MKQYKLINWETKEEFLCEKVVINGSDYYVNNSIPNNLCVVFYNDKPYVMAHDKGINNKQLNIIATNANPSINDIPKVVDEVEEAIKIIIGEEYYKAINKGGSQFNLLKRCYNHSQSTHPNSDEDMELFVEFVEANYYPVYVIDKEVSDAKDGWCERGGDDSKVYLRKELLKLWKDQRVQTIYFN